MLQVAVIEAAACIGCHACVAPCPTGAIMGATKQLHGVMAELCTACGACVAACPVPCITLQPWPQATHPLQGVNQAAAAAATARHAARVASRGDRAVAEVRAKPQAEALSLPPDLAVLAAAAREKSVQKYQKMGPLRRPRALPRGRG